MTITTITRPLGSSGLRVSPLVLGGNVFGWGADEDASFAVLDAYVAAGGTTVDTADNYSAWVPGNQGGESEALIGRWLRSRGRRDDLVIATKVGMGGGRMPRGLGRDQIRAGIEGSLERLGIDRVDVYYAHEDDLDTPLEETVRALDEIVREGLVTAVAASNYPAPRLAEALRIARREGLNGFVALQPHFNLIDRAGFEGEVEAVCRDNGLGVLAYFGLARGFLTGKYRPGGAVPAGPRAAGVQRDYFTPAGWAALAAVEEVAAAHAASPAQVALAWLMGRPGITSAIASATTPAQVRELMGAVALELSPEARERLDGVA